VNGEVRRAAVVGAGTMGVGFAQLLALGGIETIVVDASLDLAVAARDRAIAGARSFAEEGLMDPDAPGQIEARTVAGEMQDLGAVDFVIEAVPENPDLKRTVLAWVAEVVAENAVIATNTSAIPIAELAGAVPNEARFLGLHWFNPPQWVPAVEVIRGPSTDEAVERLAGELLRRLGKRPVLVGDSPGFVANRIQFAMFKEAAAVVAEGVAGAAEVDRVVSSSFGFRLPFLGPFAIADMAGLDVYAGAFEALETGLGEHLRAPAALTEAVDAGRTGAKAGGGFFDYDPADLREIVKWRDRCYVELSGLLERLAEAAPPALRAGLTEGSRDER